MASEVLLPRQGQSVESCLILSWKKNVGDPVSEGEILCEVETDKATFEVESTANGVLLARLAEEGDDVPVLTPIAVVGEPGERVEAAGTGAASGAGTSPADEAAGVPSGGESGYGAASEENGTRPAVPELGAAAARSETGATGGAAESAPEHRGVSPRARRLAEEKGVSTADLSGTGPHGRVIERDVKRALAEGAPLTPGAREAAARSGAKVTAEGTGIGGRVTAEDVTRAAAERSGIAPDSAVETGAAAAQAKPAVSAAPGAVTEEPVRGVRKLIAERMRASLASTAQLTMNAGADARKLLEYRRRLKAAPEEYGVGGITINDLVLYAVSRTLPLFPALNAHFTGEKILRYEDVHLGFAVDTPRGLVVPVIRNADRLPLAALAAEAKRLAAACLSGRIDPDELSGGTFTVTNLGSLGIESFTPVLNPPQVGILGVCSIVPKPTMKDDGGHELVPTLGLSLTIDHQVVDGAPGARFLKALADAIANLDVVLAR